MQSSLERRISNECMESAAGGHFWKFRGPVEWVPSRQLLLRVSSKLLHRSFHRALGVGRYGLARSVVIVAIEAAQFQGDETVGQRFDFGGGGFGLGMEAVLRLYLSRVVRGQLFEFTALLPRLLDIAE